MLHDAKSYVAAAIVIGSVMTVAWADNGNYVGGAAAPAMVQRHAVGQTAYVVSRPVVDANLIVGRALHEQPVNTHLAEVRVVDTTIYLDPDKDYHRDNENRLDDDHLILRAQRLHRYLNAMPARVIRNPLANDEEEAQAISTIEPRAIIPVPEGVPSRRLKTNPNPNAPDAPAPAPGAPRWDRVVQR